MFAIFETGGKQYRAEKGAKIEVEKLAEEEGKKVTFQRVFLLSDGKETNIGQPYVEGAKVEAKVLSHEKGDKVRVVKYKAKKRSKSVSGHRQWSTTIEITGVKK